MGADAMDDEKLNDEADYYWRTLIQSPTAMRNIYKGMLRNSAELLSLREGNARYEAHLKKAEHALLASHEENARLKSQFQEVLSLVRQAEWGADPVMVFRQIEIASSAALPPPQRKE